MRRTWLSVLLAASLLALLAGLYFGRRSTPPPGQPALVEIDSKTLSDLQSEFNRNAGIMRVILLLSPT
jgi:hypothetical protein